MNPFVAQGAPLGPTEHHSGAAGRTSLGHQIKHRNWRSSAFKRERSVVLPGDLFYSARLARGGPTASGLPLMMEGEEGCTARRMPVARLPRNRKRQPKNGRPAQGGIFEIGPLGPVPLPPERHSEIRLVLLCFQGLGAIAYRVRLQANCSAAVFGLYTTLNGGTIRPSGRS